MCQVVLLDQGYTSQGDVFSIYIHFGIICVFFSCYGDLRGSPSAGTCVQHSTRTATGLTALSDKAENGSAFTGKFPSSLPKGLVTFLKSRCQKSNERCSFSPRSLAQRPPGSACSNHKLPYPNASANTSLNC